MKTTIDIADALLSRAKKVAKEEGMTLRELTEQGLRLVLDRRESAPPIKFNPVVVGEPGAPVPDLSWDRLREEIYGDEAERIMGWKIADATEADEEPS